MKILTPISGPKPAREKAEYVISISKSMEAELHVIHIASPEMEGGEEAVAIFTEAAEAAGVKCTSAIREGNVVEAISAYADEMDADLIIMGASPGKMIQEWLMADFIVRSKRPMVVIPFGYEDSF
jgi:nucleotide-binding universal stress UspA family protein